MAKFNIPGNYDMVSTAFISDVSARFSTPITYTKGNNEIFIYSNHPEYPTSAHLGDGSTPVYINKVTANNKSKVLIYVTHHLDNLTEGPYKLAIRVYNPSSSSPITFTRLHEGYSNTASSNDWKNPGYAYESFFANSAGTIPVGKQSSEWLVVKDINNYGKGNGFSFLDYFGEFSVTGSFVIAIYICKNINNISSNAGEVEWKTSYSTYSGYSDCYSLTGSYDFDAANALVSYENSFFYGISNPYQNWGSPSEKITMYATQNKIPVTNNIGNYGYQYKISATLRNTSTKPVQIKLYLISNNQSHFAGLSSLNGCSRFLTCQSDDPRSSNRWNFYTVNRMESKAAPITIDFTYCHLALGSRGAILQFEATEL